MVRYAILGTGLMGVEHLRNLMALADDGAGVVVTALADPHPASLAAAVDAWTEHYAAVAAAAAAAANGRVPLAAVPPPPPATYPSAAALYAAGDPPPFDVLVVATPNYTHAAVVLAALAALPPTTHLLVEKPLCTTVADCRALVADVTARRWRGVLWNALEYRYMPAVAEVVRRTWQGGVGRVVMAALREHRFPFLDKVGGWNRFNCWSGGTLVEKCCHFFNLLNLLHAPARPTSIMASASQSVNHLEEVHPAPPGSDAQGATATPDILDNALVIVNYGTSARASLDLCMFAESSAHQEELSVVGAAGKLEALLPQNTVRTGLRGVHTVGAVDEATVADASIKFDGYHYGSSYRQHIEFLATIRGGGVPGKGALGGVVGLAEGLLAVAMGVAAQESVVTPEEIEAGVAASAAAAAATKTAATKTAAMATATAVAASVTTSAMAGAQPTVVPPCASDTVAP
ncbi:hypothetical protein MMPV_000980 [Pyropia vietnamensis]